MKVLFTANVPAPYRVDFFNELGKLCDLTVIFERRTAASRNRKWLSADAKTYREIYLDGIETGEAEALSFGLIKYVKDKSFDKIIIGMYSSPSAMIAIEYMRIHRIPFYLSTDGGFVEQEPHIKKAVKKHLISSASRWLSPGDNATEYLVYYGAVRNKVYKYPFTSLTEFDLKYAEDLCSCNKQTLRDELGMEEEQILLSVGRFSYEGGYGKGYDTLMEAAEFLSPAIGIYIVGDEPTPEFVSWKEKKNLTHVHFIGFKEKEELAKYYAASDAFILLTRKDAWGLVINEAMSFRLPVITTNQCMAGLELVRNNENGFLVDAGDVTATVTSVRQVFSSQEVLARMGSAGRKRIESYTIENMASVHYKFLSGTFR